MYKMTLSDIKIDNRFSKMAESQSKEIHDALIRDLDEQYKICKYFTLFVSAPLFRRISILFFNHIYYDLKLVQTVKKIYKI